MGRRPASATVAEQSDAPSETTVFEAEPPTRLPEFSLTNVPTITADFPDIAADYSDDLPGDEVEPQPLTESEMFANSLPIPDFDEEEEMDDEDPEREYDEADLLFDDSGEDEDGDEQGEEEGAEDEGGEEPATDPKPKKEAALDPAVAEAIQAMKVQQEEFAKRMAELENEKAEIALERERAKREAEFSTEAGRKRAEIEKALSAEYDGLEDIDPRAFNRLVEAEMREWESSRRGEINKELEAIETERKAEAEAKRMEAIRDAEISTFLSALPEGARLLSHKTSTEGTWGELVADIYRLAQSNGVVNAPFPDFAKSMATELQSVFEAGRKVGQADTAKKLSKGQSSPPPVTPRGGSGKSETRPTAKGAFSPEGIRDMLRGTAPIPLFGDIAATRRTKR